MSGTEGEVERAENSVPAHAELSEGSERMFENIYLNPLLRQ